MTRLILSGLPQGIVTAVHDLDHKLCCAVARQTGGNRADVARIIANHFGFEPQMVELRLEQLGFAEQPHQASPPGT